MKTLAITTAAILMSAASSFAQCKAKVGHHSQHRQCSKQNTTCITLTPVFRGFFEAAKPL
jgi:hypothetical protein